MYRPLYRTVSHIFRYRYWAYDSGGKFLPIQAIVSATVLYIFRNRYWAYDCIGKFQPTQATVSVDTEDFVPLKQYFNKKKYLLMRWSDFIASKSSFWSDEVTFDVLKSIKKIGRYNRKLGICIRSSEGQNFAHLCLFLLIGIARISDNLFLECTHVYTGCLVTSCSKKIYIYFE